jgi:hypothetical protein
MFKIYVSISLLIFSSIGLLIALKLVQNTHVFRPQAQVVGVSLALKPQSLNLNSGDSFTLDVFMNSANELITTVELGLIYDPQFLIIESIEKEVLFPKMVNNDLSQVGVAKAVLMADPEKDERRSGVIARIKGRAKKEGVGQIGFTKETRAHGFGKDQDLIEAVSGSIITIGAREEFPTVWDDMKDRRRVDRVLDEYYIKLEEAEKINNQSKPGGIAGLVQQIFTGITQFVSNINESLEGGAEEVLEK